jgi:hypothetical protein
MYVTEGELKENGVKVDGVVYSAMVGAGAEGWMGKEGFLIQGPYDVHRLTVTKLGFLKQGLSRF